MDTSRKVTSTRPQTSAIFVLLILFTLDKHYVSQDRVITQCVDVKPGFGHSNRQTRYRRQLNKHADSRPYVAWDDGANKAYGWKMNFSLTLKYSIADFFYIVFRLMIQQWEKVGSLNPPLLQIQYMTRFDFCSKKLN